MKLITFALPLFFAFSILLGESKLLQPETKKNYNDFNNLSFNEILNFLSTTDKGLVR